MGWSNGASYEMVVKLVFLIERVTVVFIDQL